MAQTETTLQTLLNFTDHDLAANRAGEITPAQQHRLERTRRTTSRLFLVAAILCVLIAVASLVANVPMAALIFGGLGLALLGGIYWSVRRQSLTIADVPIAARQGGITLDRVRRRRTGARAATHYTLTVDGLTFTIDRNLHTWLLTAKARREDDYTVYYLAGQNRILSMEEGLAPLDAFTQTDRPATLPTNAIGRAIAVLESRRPPGTPEEAEAARAQALDELRSTGPDVVYALAAHLHKPLYRDLIVEFGDQAIAPLMRLTAREGALVESPLLENIVKLLHALPLEAIQEKVPPYLARYHSPSVRMVALRALSHRRNFQRIAILRDAAQDPEPAIAARAQHTLARLDEFYGWK